MLQTVAVIFLISIIVLKVYQKLTCGICKSSAHLVGKVVIITGGNSGIGFETSLNLAERGARLLLACRNEKRGIEARDRIVALTGNTNVHYRHLDLASLTSVRKFAQEILNTESRLDVLLNNAGAGGLGNYKTKDGLHIGMQVNYFASFLLTCLLLPLLKSSAPSRIINVSSVIHKYGDVDFENLNMEKYWSDYLVYTNSKLYVNLMTLELSKRLKGTNVTVNSLHPGVSGTNLFRNIPTRIMRNGVKFILNFFYKSSREAAQTSIYLAVSPEVRNVSGRYFADCREAKPSAKSLDQHLASRLWAVSEKLVQLNNKRN